MGLLLHTRSRTVWHEKVDALAGGTGGRVLAPLWAAAPSKPSVVLQLPLFLFLGVTAEVGPWLFLFLCIPRGPAIALWRVCSVPKCILRARNSTVPGTGNSALAALHTCTLFVSAPEGREFDHQPTMAGRKARARRVENMTSWQRRLEILGTL